jgi:protein-S-isoprenylcysteine O-methyltransferase Ste14
VLESKRLLPALAGSVNLMTKTWREILGCILVFGAIILLVAAVALVIGQSPLLLNHDYDFFLQFSRGKVLMTVACYGFLLASGILMAIGSTIIGIATTELYRIGEREKISG